jgi:hypothetical protein
MLRRRFAKGWYSICQIGSDILSERIPTQKFLPLVYGYFSSIYESGIFQTLIAPSDPAVNKSFSTFSS